MRVSSLQLQLTTRVVHFEEKLQAIFGLAVLAVEVVKEGHVEPVL